MMGVFAITAFAATLLFVISPIAFAMSSLVPPAPTASSTNHYHQLIAHKMCPFVHKVWLALEASQTPYEFVEIDLYGSNGKPAWFCKLNPKGTVPVLVCCSSSSSDNRVVYTDSSEILDALITDNIPGSTVALLCSSPEQVPTIQSWRDRTIKLLPVGKQAVLAGQLTVELKQALRDFDAAVIIGPYLIGTDLSMADCDAFPFVWRLNQEFDLDAYPQIQQWLACMLGHPAVQRTLPKSWWWWW